MWIMFNTKRFMQSESKAQNGHWARWMEKFWAVVTKAASCHLDELLRKLEESTTAFNLLDPKHDRADILLSDNLGSVDHWKCTWLLSLKAHQWPSGRASGRALSFWTDFLVWLSYNTHGKKQITFSTREENLAIRSEKNKVT